MRSLLSWLMVFVAMAGLNVRVLAAGAVHETTCCHPVETCCVDHHEASTSQDDQDHEHDGQKCPSEHHHHHVGCCSHPLPLTIDNDVISRLGVPGVSLVGYRHECEVPPEGPFLSSEKPPLI